MNETLDGIAYIHFFCPTRRLTVAVGPQNYRLFLSTIVDREKDASPLYGVTIEIVDCPICRGTHNLATWNPPTLPAEAL